MFKIIKTRWSEYQIESFEWPEKLEKKIKKARLQASFAEKNRSKNCHIATENYFGRKRILSVKAFQNEASWSPTWGSKTLYWENKLSQVDVISSIFKTLFQKKDRKNPVNIQYVFPLEHILFSKSVHKLGHASLVCETKQIIIKKFVKVGEINMTFKFLSWTKLSKNNGPQTTISFW